MMQQAASTVFFFFFALTLRGVIPELYSTDLELTLTVANILRTFVIVLLKGLIPFIQNHYYFKQN